MHLLIITGEDLASGSGRKKGGGKGKGSGGAPSGGGKEKGAGGGEGKKEKGKKPAQQQVAATEKWGGVSVTDGGDGQKHKTR